MSLEKAVSLSARYDTSVAPSLRGWLIDLVFENGGELTIPAPPEIYILEAYTPLQQVEDGTRAWLKERQKARAWSSGLHVKV
jgi:hypothetical protein